MGYYGWEATGRAVSQLSVQQDDIIKVTAQPFVSVSLTYLRL